MSRPSARNGSRSISRIHSGSPSSVGGPLVPANAGAAATHASTSAVVSAARTYGLLMDSPAVGPAEVRAGLSPVTVMTLCDGQGLDYSVRIRARARGRRWPVAPPSFFARPLFSQIEGHSKELV